MASQGTVDSPIVERLMNEKFQPLIFHKRWSGRQHGRHEQAFNARSVAFAGRFSKRKENLALFNPKKPSPNAGPLADMWASIFTHLLTAKRDNPNPLRDALWTCTAILQDQGYRVKAVTKDVIPSRSFDVAMLVPGCQTPKLLTRRALVGAQVWCQMMGRAENTRCLLSGARPPSLKRITIPNESDFMRKEFVEFLARHQNKHPESLDVEMGIVSRDVRCDPKADTTETNVRKFVEAIRADKRENLRLIVAVSSTFHLIRLAKELESQLSKMWDRQYPAPKNLSLVLVGAETDEFITEPEKSHLIWDPMYMKSLFFEVFSYLAMEGQLPTTTPP